MEKRVDEGIALYYKVIMKTIKSAIAALELILLFPGVVFMGALVVRSIQPTQYEPAKSAQHLVDWFAIRPFLGLDVFLIAMPMLAFLVGCGWIFKAWYGDDKFRGAMLELIATARSHGAALLVAGATLVAGGILGVVALHMITD